MKVPRGVKMLVQPISGFKLFDVYPKLPVPKQQYYSVPNYSNVAFCALTSAGQAFKKLKNVPDAFFGGITINSSDISRISNELKKCTTVKKAVQYLKKYKPNMLKTERVIFERFEAVAQNSPRMKFQDLLQKWYPDALSELKREEFAVIDEIDKIALSLSNESMVKVRRETTKCSTAIIENDPQNTFKRKPALGNLLKIDVKPEEEKIMAKLLEKATYLPTSVTSENAFIVKYAGRSHNEIAFRLVSPSVATIDHVQAASRGGTNDIGNFLLTSAGANTLKQDMWFKKFVKRFPEIIANCQKYIDFIINVINRGGLKGNQAYPYKIRKTLIKESDGKVKLDLSLLKYTKEEAKALEKQTCHGSRNLKQQNFIAEI